MILKKLAMTVITLAVSLCTAASVSAAQWQQDTKGWWYDYEDGSYAANRWEQINGSWYRFGNDGYMQTGWQQINGCWYYLQPDGAMASDTVIDGYRLGADGIMQEASPAVPEAGYGHVAIAMEISAGKNTDILHIQFTNYSASEMKLINGDNHTFSNLDSKYDRDMNLCDAAGNPLDSLIIKPGETKMAYYKLTSSTWYDSRQNVMVVGIEHNGDYSLLFADIFDVPVD